MKNKMREVSKMTRLRDMELLNDYRRIVGEAYSSGKTIVRREVIKELLENGRPRYYVNFENAYNMMIRMRKHNITGSKLTLKRQMWIEIHDRVKCEMERNPQLALHHALARVLSSQRASRYFISADYAYKYIYRLIHEMPKKYSRAC